MGNKKEPIDYLMDVIGWGLFTPMMITFENKSKVIKTIGRLLCIPFVMTWVFTGIPVLLCIIILGIAQMFYE